MKHFSGTRDCLPLKFQPEGAHDITIEDVETLSRHFDVAFLALDVHVRQTEADRRGLFLDDLGRKFRQR